MSSIVIYTSKTGYTKQYAQWLGESLNCNSFPLSDLGGIKLEPFDTLIYGGSIMGGGIRGLSAFLKKTAPYQDKQIIVFGVGAAAANASVLKTMIEKNNLTNHPHIQTYYFQGGFDPEKLGFVMKAMLSKVAKGMQKKAEKNPESLTDEDRAFLDFFQTSHSSMSREALNDLIASVK